MNKLIIQAFQNKQKMFDFFSIRSIFLLYFPMNYWEIKTNNLTVSDSDIISFNFTVSKNRILCESFINSVSC